jgi:hypothetical protein
MPAHASLSVDSEVLQKVSLPSGFVQNPVQSGRRKSRRSKTRRGWLLLRRVRAVFEIRLDHIGFGLPAEIQMPIEGITDGADDQVDLG